MATYYQYPISDIDTASDWVGSYVDIDDPQGSPDDAATEYNCKKRASAAFVSVGLTATNYSISDGTIRVRAKKGAAAASATLTVGLYQSTTLIASFSPTLTDAYANYSYALTSGEVANITDTTTLRIRLTGTTGTSNSDTIEVTQAYLEALDAVVTREFACASSSNLATSDITVDITTEANFAFASSSNISSSDITVNTTSATPTVTLDYPSDTYTGQVTELRFTGTDPNSDNVTYEVEISSGSGESITDSYSTYNDDQDLQANFQYSGQCFTAGGGEITKVSFHMDKVGSPTGNITAYIYAMAGTYGTSGYATGTPLATSNTVSATTVGVSPGGWIDFTFPTPYSSTTGEHLCIVVHYLGTTTDYVSHNIDGTTASHDGNWFRAQGSQNFSEWPDAAFDGAFRVYETSGTTNNYLSDTDTGFSGTDPYTSGNQVTYTIQQALVDLTEYTWRVRAKDPSGSNTWGTWATAQTFTYEESSDVTFSLTSSSSLSSSDISVDGAYSFAFSSSSNLASSDIAVATTSELVFGGNSSSNLSSSDITVTAENEFSLNSSSSISSRDIYVSASAEVLFSCASASSLSSNDISLSVGRLFTLASSSSVTSGDISLDVEAPPTVALDSPSNGYSGVVTELKFTGTDPNNDDVTYEVEISSGSGETLEDNYDAGTWDDDSDLSGNFQYGGQCFTAQGGPIAKVGFHLDKLNSPAGNMVAYIYAMTGTYGVDAVPTGSALATSNTVAASTVVGPPGGWVDFTFPTPYDSTLNEQLCCVLYYIGTGTDYVSLNLDTGGTGHGGNWFRAQSSQNWTGYSGWDAGFRIYEGGGTTNNYLSDTDTGFSGTDPYTSGSQVTYTIQQALSDGVEYTWRVRALDPSGSNTWGEWATAQTFTAQDVVAFSCSSAGNLSTADITLDIELNERIFGPTSSSSLSTSDIAVTIESEYSFSFNSSSNLVSAAFDLRVIYLVSSVWQFDTESTTKIFSFNSSSSVSTSDAQAINTRVISLSSNGSVTTSDIPVINTIGYACSSSSSVYSSDITVETTDEYLFAFDSSSNLVATDTSLITTLQFIFASDVSLSSADAPLILTKAFGFASSSYVSSSDISLVATNNLSLNSSSNLYTSDITLGLTNNLSLNSATNLATSDITLGVTNNLSLDSSSSISTSDITLGVTNNLALDSSSSLSSSDATLVKTLAFEFASSTSLTTSDAEALAERDITLSSSANLISSTPQLGITGETAFECNSSGSLSTTDSTLVVERVFSFDSSASLTSGDATVINNITPILSSSSSLVASDITVETSDEYTFSLTSSNNLVASDITVDTHNDYIFSLSSNSSLDTSDITVDTYNNYTFSLSSASGLTASDISVETYNDYIFSLTSAASLSASDASVINTIEFSFDASSSITASDAYLIAGSDIEFYPSSSSSITTSDSNLSVERPLALSSSGSLSTSDISASISTEYTFALSSSCSLTSGDAEAILTREFGLSSSTSLSTSDISADITWEYIFAFASATSVTSSDIDVNREIELQADSSSNLASSDVGLDGLYEFSFASSGSASTSDIPLRISNDIEFTTTSSSSLTSGDATLNIEYTLAASSVGSLSASDIDVNREMELSFSVSSELSSSVVGVSIPRFLSLDSSSYLSTTEIFVGVFNIVYFGDTNIEQVTVSRTISSITVSRTIEED